jgi:hypothetical protein
MRKVAASVTALVALTFVGSLQAHHSISMFDIGKPIWIKGTVVRFDPINPHVMFTLERKQDDGQVQRWIVEGRGLRSFTRMGLGNDYLQPGEVVEVCGFGLKEEVLARHSGQHALGGARPSLHGHVLVTSDGHMRIFGGYGKLVNCVRPTDQVETWVTFLNSGARDAWCGSQVLSNSPSVAPQAFVDEVNRRLADPCPPLAEE